MQIPPLLNKKFIVIGQISTSRAHAIRWCWWWTAYNECMPQISHLITWPVMLLYNQLLQCCSIYQGRSKIKNKSSSSGSYLGWKLPDYSKVLSSFSYPHDHPFYWFMSYDSRQFLSTIILIGMWFMDIGELSGDEWITWLQSWMPKTGLNSIIYPAISTFINHFL